MSSRPARPFARRRARHRAVRRTPVVAALSAFALTGGLLVAGAQPAAAAVILVGPDCSLQDAVTAAETDAAVGGCAAGSGIDTIALGPGTYPANIVLRGRVTLVGVGGTVLDGGGLGTVVTVAPGAQVVMDGLIIRGGRGADGVTQPGAFSSPGTQGAPGGILNEGTLVLANSDLLDNRGGNGGMGFTGGLFGGAGASGGAGGPGAILSTGTLSLDRVFVANNTGGVGGPGSNGRQRCTSSPTGPQCDATPQPGGAGGAGGAGAFELGGSTTFGPEVDGLLRDNTGGAGGVGGDGFLADPAVGGAGGPGAVYVRDLARVTGDTARSGNTPGVPGNGAESLGEIRRGAAALTWVSPPPSQVLLWEKFNATYGSTSPGDVTETFDGCSQLPTVPPDLRVLADRLGTCTITVAQTDTVYLLAPNDLVARVSVLDGTAPVVVPELSAAPNEAGWHHSEVTVGWAVTDPESPVTSTEGCETTTVTTDGKTTLTCTATSPGGATTDTVTVLLDTAAPALAPVATPSVVTVGAPLPVVTAGAADATSGVADSGCDVPSDATATSGIVTVTCTATDLAGNTGTATVDFAVVDGVSEILAPLANLEPVKAGQAVPVKFVAAPTGTYRAVLTADGAAVEVASCAFDRRAGLFSCTLKTPKRPDPTASYAVALEQDVDGTWVRTLGSDGTEAVTSILLR
jgi:hypothetical protein